MQILTAFFFLSLRMVMYKRRQYYVPGPSTMPNKRKGLSSGGNLYRKRIAYTELRDMNND